MQRTEHPVESRAREHADGRLRIAIVAFGCAPDSGSEQGGGWTWAWAAAERHDVWLVTDACNRSAIDAELRRRPEAHRLQPIYVAQTRLVPVPATSGRLIRLRYALWVASASRAIRRLRRLGVSFDLGHHVTFSNDWFPPAFWRHRDLPFVWGPIGGAPPLSWRALRWMGWRGAAKEVVRTALTDAGRLTAGRSASKRASLVIAQNDTVAARVRTSAPVVVEPHIAIDPRDLHLRAEVDAPTTEVGAGQQTRRAVFAGRILPWKGGALAIAGLAAPLAADWQLTVYGDGPDLPRLQRLARRYGVTDRVEFVGRRPRRELLDALATADALLFPSLADAGGWIVAEAMALGCPVVCVDRGGPPSLIGHGGGVIVPLGRHTADRIARALHGLGGRSSPDERWAVDRLPDVVDDLYQRALGADTGSASRREAALR